MIWYGIVHAVVSKAAISHGMVDVCEGWLAAETSCKRQVPTNSNHLPYHHAKSPGLVRAQVEYVLRRIEGTY